MVTENFSQQHFIDLGDSLSQLRDKKCTKQLQLNTHSIWHHDQNEWWERFDY